MSGAHADEFAPDRSEWPAVRDEPPPRWWGRAFMATIVFSVCYWSWYHVGSGATIHEKLDAETAAHSEALVARLGLDAADDATILRLAADTETMSAMRGTFVAHCAPCHRADGGGGIGPDLTDEYWKTVRRPSDLYQVITSGVPGTSMTAWERSLREPQRILLAAYVASRRGSAPANGKGAEGTVIPAWDEARPDEVIDAPPRRAAGPSEPGESRDPPPGYEATLRDLHQELGARYPCFALKGIDWAAVGGELLPRAAEVESDEAFGLLCMEFVARLEDSHARLLPGDRELPEPPLPRWDSGLACLIDDRDAPVVYAVEPGSPAAAAGITPGTTVRTVDGAGAVEALERCMAELRRYRGFSSERAARYAAARAFLRRPMRGEEIMLTVRRPDGGEVGLVLAATEGPRYLPRLPVSIPGIADAANVSWTMLGEGVGYVYVRRIREDLVERLDRAVADLAGARAMIVDLRGNSGGGFDRRESHVNFDPDAPGRPERPRFAGPMAVLVDARCVSAGEGWGSWFAATGRARLIGGATAGASSRKTTYRLRNGLYRVLYPVKAYTGFLDRPIEGRGLEPDIVVRVNAADLAAGRDTVLETALEYLRE